MKKFLMLILALACVAAGLAQQKNVSGVVSDIGGEPLIGVAVSVKGKDVSSITDIDGRYSIMASAQDVLLFTYVGFLNVEEPVGGRSTIDVVMKDNTEELDEVVVVGYGTMKKSDLTGAVVRANLKDLEKSPNTNLLQSLQGTVPGLNIGMSTEAGTTPSMSIRGTNTISGNSSVLIILDGVIYNSSLTSINPADIESIDVLKDASATAVYGAQAANGVLLITTKKGSEGKTKVSFSTAYSISNPTKNYRPMNRSEYLQFMTNFFYDKAYLAPEYTTPNPDFDLSTYLPDAAMRDINQPDGISATDYDWWDEGTQSGHIFENRLSISGGNSSVKYLISYENVSQQGTMINDDFKRNSARVNLDINPYKWLRLGVQAFGSFINQDGVGVDMATLIRSCPLVSPYAADGSYVVNPLQTLDVNPFLATSASDKDRHNYFFGNVTAEIILPVKGLTYRVNWGNNYRIDQRFYANQYDASQAGDAYKNNTTYYDWTVDNILNYNNTFGKHGIAATLLYGASERKYDFTGADAKKFSRMTLGFNSLELGTDQYTTSDAWKESLNYQMARLNYKFDDKYLVTATVRRDGFSGFAENNKSAVFPSFALGWVISNEGFFNASFVNFLKLRAGWGISGNLTSRYSSLAKVSSEAGYVFGDGGSTELRQQISSMGNDKLKWEKTKGFNFGLDFSLFHGRLHGSVEAYTTKTHDLLWSMSIPSITGYKTVATNIGELSNKGVELTLTSHNIASKDFEWTTTFNISHNTNKINSLFGKDADGDGKEDDLVASGLFIGESVNAIYGYKIDGIYQLDDDIPAGYHPGNYKIHDVDGDGQITTNDRTIIGSSDPLLRFGIMNSLRFKNFNLSFFINSVQGGKDGYLGNNSSQLNQGDANNKRWNSLNGLGLDYWSPSNPGGHYSMSTARGAISPSAYQSRTFVRLQDVNLAYNLPSSLVSHIGLESVNVYFSAKNLLTFTNWRGWDPEANSNFWGRPVMRTFSFGLNLTI
ncbi:MAG: TonB-dependent receptor [Clostridium sp.]|nr:TonB-dependent receptor [Clostridium sp.]